MTNLEWVRTDGGPEDTHWRSWRAYAGERREYQIDVEYCTSGGFSVVCREMVFGLHAPDDAEARQKAEDLMHFYLTGHRAGWLEIPDKETD